MKCVSNWIWLNLHESRAILIWKEISFFASDFKNHSSHCKRNCLPVNEDVLVSDGHPQSVRTLKLWWDAASLTLLVLIVNILHTVVFTMTLLWITINITSTQTNEEGPHRGTWLQCAAWKTFSVRNLIISAMICPVIIWIFFISVNDYSVNKTYSTSTQSRRNELEPLVLIVAHILLRIFNIPVNYTSFANNVCLRNVCVYKLIDTFIWYDRSVAWFKVYSVEYVSVIILFSLRAALKDIGEPENKRWPSFDCVTSEWALFMRLPACHSHITMNCEQDFGDGGLGVTLTLRLLMHGKVQAFCSHCLWMIVSCRIFLTAL